MVLQYLSRIPLAAIVGVSLCTATGFCGGLWWFFDLFSHFRVQYMAISLMLLLVTMLLRQARSARLAVLVLSVNGLVIAPQLVPELAAQAPEGRAIRFVFANVRMPNEDPRPLLRFLAEARADVIVLAEVNPRWHEDLAELEDAYPHQLVETRERGLGIGLWSRTPMHSASVVHFAHERIPSIVARFDDFLLIGTHSLAPGAARRTELRNAQLEAIAETAEQESGPVVVLGDLNTTPWGHGFRRLVARSGLVDSRRGRGLFWSWPAEFWPLGIPIDHALATQDIVVLDRFMGPNVGSDHFPVVVDVAVPVNSSSPSHSPTDQ